MSDQDLADRIARLERLVTQLQLALLLLLRKAAPEERPSHRMQAPDLGVRVADGTSVKDLPGAG